MLPRPFEYLRPENLDGALAELARRDDAIPYAGGTELLLILKMHLAEYSVLIDLKRLPELRDIAVVDGVLHIGAMATHATIARDPVVKDMAPALADLCGSIANPRVRAAGTIGGNLCFAEPSADPPTLLAAMNATLHLVSTRGARMVPADEFIKGPLQTVRADDEILLRVEISGGRQATRYVRQLHGHRALAGAAASIPTDTDITPRVWLGGAAERPVPLTITAGYLARAGDKLETASLVRKIEEDISTYEIVGDHEASADYRRHIAAVLARRAVIDAWRAAGREIAR